MQVGVIKRLRLGGVVLTNDGGPGGPGGPLGPGGPAKPGLPYMGERKEWCIHTGQLLLNICIFCEVHIQMILLQWKPLYYHVSCIKYGYS